MAADSRQIRPGALAIPRDALRSRRARAVRPARIVGSMALAIVACGGAAYWGEYRETEASRVDFAHEQTTLAKGVAVALATRLQEAPLTPVRPVDALREVVATVEEPGTLLAFLSVEDGSGLVGTSGRAVRSPRIEAALDEGRCLGGQGRMPCWLRLSHEESAALGLPPRTSVAALSGFIEPGGAKRGVVIAATARRHSDREEHAELRLALAFLFSSGLVLAFGTLALRTQRQELELERELAVADAVRERDERLGRADKMAALGALATGIAHQVATPLGVITGRVEQLLPKVAGDERARRAVVAIAEQTRRIEAIIRAFLGVARGGAPALEHVDPAQLASAAVGFVEHRFAQSAVHLVTEAASPLPQVACDPRLVEQAIVNLLLNACDACEGGGHVELSVQSEGGHVTFSVTDDGVGISPAAASRATEPFFTTKPEGQGSGLGLAIASEIVAHHHGELTVAPRGDGRGTRACIRIDTLEERPHG
jgi:two-component system, NtrC family, sensor kinase